MGSTRIGCDRATNTFTFHLFLPLQCFSGALKGLTCGRDTPSSSVENRVMFHVRPNTQWGQAVIPGARHKAWREVYPEIFGLN